MVRTRQALTTDVANVLRNRQDDISKAVDLPVQIAPTLEAGYWQGQSNPTIPLVIDPKSIEGPDHRLTDAGKQKLDGLSAIIGRPTYQNAMAYTHGVMGSSTPNAYRFVAEEPLIRVDLENIGLALDKVLGPNAHALIQEPGGQLRILNTSLFGNVPISDKTFRLTLERELGKLGKKGIFYGFETTETTSNQKNMTEKSADSKEPLVKYGGMIPPDDPFWKNSISILPMNSIRSTESTPKKPE